MSMPLVQDAIIELSKWVDMDVVGSKYKNTLLLVIGVVFRLFCGGLRLLLLLHHNHGHCLHLLFLIAC